MAVEVETLIEDILLKVDAALYRAETEVKEFSPDQMLQAQILVSEPIWSILRQKEGLVSDPKVARLTGDLGSYKGRAIRPLRYGAGWTLIFAPVGENAGGDA